VTEPYVVLSEEDYVQAHAGNKREHYQPALAHASRLRASEAQAAVWALADERGLGNSLSPQLALGLVREVMLARYQAESERTAS